MLQFAPWAGLTSVAWGVVTITALVSTVMARLILFAGIRRIGSGQAAHLAPVETLLTVNRAGLLLGEHLSTPQWLGGILVVASVLLAAAPLARNGGPLPRGGGVEH